jgi:hypothetical protein
MKTLSILSFFFLLQLFVALPIQAQSSTMEIIKSALKTGNTTELSQFFAAKFDLILFDDEDHLTKAEAVTKLNAFFAQNRPNGFTQKHETVAPNGAKCLIGILSTSSGSFRTTVLVLNGKIEEIVIER